MSFFISDPGCLRGLAAAAIVGAACWSGQSVRAAPSEVPVIDGGSLADALRRIGVDTHTTILFSPVLVAGRRAGHLRLRGDATAMLHRLLSGSGLRLRVIGPHTILIEAAPPVTMHVPVPVPVAMAPGDIMVTAMRRPTLLADTPVSMIAVTGGDLDRAGATGLQGLAALAPSLTATAMGPGINRLSLRGVFAAGEPTVGVYYGAVPVVGPAGSSTDPGLMTPDLMLVDIDRIEVLRGPQGTLFGTNSLAGTVRILFNSPDLTRLAGSVAAGVTLTQGGGPGNSQTAMVNLPLVDDRLALRAVAYREVKGGVIDNPGLGLAHIDHQTRSGGRLALRWQAGPTWRVDLTGIYQQGNIADSSDATAGAGIDQTTTRTRTPFNDRLIVAGAEVNGAIGTLQFNLALSHYGWDPHRRLDFSASEGSHGDDPAACAAWLQQTCSAQGQAAFAAYVDSQTPAILDQPLTVQVDSGEARLSGSGTLTWTTGAFLSRRRDTGISTALAADKVTGLVDPDTPPTAARHFETSLDEYALFGDGSWHARPWLTLSAGGRYFDYRREASGLVSIPNPITGPFAASSFEESYRADGAVGRARIELRPGPGLLVFGQVSSGFRPGGINVVPGLDPALAAYRDDRLTSWEGGGRMRFDGDRLRMDFAAYRQLWSRMQYAAATTDGSYGFITNIGSARIDGGELSLSYEPGRHLLTRLEVTWTDARLSSNQIDATASTAGLRGDRLPYVAPLAASFDIEFDHRLARDLTMLAAINAHYTGRAYDSFRSSSDEPRQAMGNSGTIDAAIGLRQGAGRIDLSVQNLANDRAIVWIGRPLNTDMLQRARPRAITVSLHRTF